ncbi:hypothetical protein [Streptomyces chartreusis]|uniref:hypothetical protein n=1 Tax=Streptomyces chartreusis TaxID=1969 RepID=UPI0037DC4AF4|nr:hypothetical protein OG938_48060 [Streptomyces chartreusis]
MPDLEIHQYEVAGHLGRHLVLDPRSLAYRRRYAGDPIRPVEWAPKVPVLDQQNLGQQGIRTSLLFEGVDDVDALGSCTGNAATALISVLHDIPTLGAVGLDVTDSVSAERWAIGLYSDATHRDQWHTDAWPAADCGSSGLGVAKALRARGLVDQYGHATTAEELGTLLQTGPVLMGLAWLSAFSDPDPDGFIDADPTWATSPLEGGHEVCITALEDVTTNPDGTLADSTVLRFVNSWGAWGDQGHGRMTIRSYRTLRPEIDLTQPRLDVR